MANVGQAFSAGLPPKQTKDQKNPPKDGTLVQLNAQVPEDLRRRFKLKAIEEGTTMSELVTTWVTEYLAGKR